MRTRAVAEVVVETAMALCSILIKGKQLSSTCNADLPPSTAGP
jgi:hypothetical protein